MAVQAGKNDLRREALEAIATDERLSGLYEDIEPRLPRPSAHDLEHALRVAAWTLRFAGESTPRHLSIGAALCHDLASLPKSCAQRSESAARSSDEARTILESHGFDRDAFFHPTDPFAADRDLDDRHYTIDHFYTKLLRLPETMQTDAGRAEGYRRVETMRGFRQELGTELSTGTVGDASTP